MKKYILSATLCLLALPFLAVHAQEAEPSYNSGSQVLIFQDDLDTYNTFEDTVPSGWRCTNGSTSQDISGSCQVISGGYNGSGKAIRLDYLGILGPGVVQEGHSWSRGLNDTLAAKPGHTLYVSYYYRITPGGGFTVDDATHSIFVKWFEMWSGAGAGRAQFSTAYQICARDGYNTISRSVWNFVGNSAGNTTCQATQLRGPAVATGQGQWHRVTYKYVTQSGTGGPQPIAWNAVAVGKPYAGTGVGNHDGVAQMWVDGTLIVSVAPGYCGTNIPGIPVGGVLKPPHWCEDEDLGAMYVNDYVQSITLGSLQNAAGKFWPFTFDFDHFIVWRDTGAGYVPPPAVPPTPPPATPTPTPTPTPPTPGTPDTTPPVIQSGGPSGSFEGATSATLSVSTNERSTCKFDQKSGLDYSRMSYTFALTGGAIHSQPFSGLTPQTYTFYVKCLDESKNITPSDYTITFSITGSTTPTPTPTPTDPLQDLVNLILTNRPLFTKATALGITLPPLITKVLNTGTLTQSDLTSLSSTLTVSTPTTYTFSRNLGLGSSGSDVQNLELFLINRNTGPAAQALKAHGVTDYFGPLTQAALREYQVSQGIEGTGYLGNTTRGYLNAGK